ncbi:MAG: hypothetical protein M3Z37_04250 [Candidatus Eremiobacteraeota bacterium]|nr:hypothetical protein [Candidatus Eremiobacteraeota bacterium]
MPDGYGYGQMMLRDKGYSKSAAQLRVRDWYLTLGLGKDPRYRPLFFESTPMQRRHPGDRVFASRVLYPQVASWLYDRFGMESLIIVSIAAFGAATITLCILLSMFGPPWMAAIGSIAIMSMPVIREIGSWPTTDMLALFFWLLAFTAAVGYAKDRHTATLVLFSVSCVLLALTRPSFVLPLASAFGLFVGSLVSGRQADRRSGMLLFAAGALGALAYFVAAALTHSENLTQHLAYVQELAVRLSPNPTLQPVWAWYLQATPRVYIIELSHFSPRHHLWYFTFALLVAIGLYVNRHHWTVPLMAGALCGALSLLALNPDIWSTARVFEVPSLPIAGAAIMLLIQKLFFGGKAMLPEGRPPYTVAAG